MARDRLRKPREPAVGECCGSGCTRCVWDVYYDELAKYEAARVALKTSAPDEGDNADSDASCHSHSSASLDTGSSDQDDEEDLDDDSDSYNGQPANFIGAVVVKFIAKPSHLDSAAAEKIVLRDIAQRHQIAATVASCELVQCSNDYTTHRTHTSPICVMNVRLSPPLTIRPCPGDVIHVFMPNAAATPAGGCTSGITASIGCDSDAIRASVDDDRRRAAHENDAVCPHTTMDRVASVCDLLALSPDAWCELHRSPFVPEGHFPPWLPQRQPMTVRLLLTYYVDIASSSYLLRPTFFESLLNIYELQLRRTARQTSQSALSNAQRREEGSAVEASTMDAGVSALTEQVPDTPAAMEATPELLRALCAKEGTAELYRELTQAEYPTCYPCLVDVLRVFRFVRVPLARLLEISSPLRTRQFSLADWFNHPHRRASTCSVVHPGVSTDTDTKDHSSCGDGDCATDDAYAVRESASTCTHIQLCVRQLQAVRPSCTELSARMVHPVARQLAMLLNKAATRCTGKNCTSDAACTSDETTCRSHSRFCGNISYPLCAQVLGRFIDSNVGRSTVASLLSVANNSSALHHTRLSDIPAPSTSMGHPDRRCSGDSRGSASACSAAERPTAGPVLATSTMYVGISSLGASTPFARELSRAVEALLSQCGSAVISGTRSDVCACVSRSRVAAHAAAAPLLLVGAGTGIAPMMAAVHTLLRHRQQHQGRCEVEKTADCRHRERHSSSEVESSLARCGAVMEQTTSSTVNSDTYLLSDPALPCIVFYGARSMSELVYDRTLGEACRWGVVQRYERAVSRELASEASVNTMTQEEDCYADDKGGCARVRHGRVTDLLRLRAAVVRHALLEAGGRLFACGPAKMLRDTRDTLMKEVLLSPEEKNAQTVCREELEQRMSALEARSQVIFESWSKLSVFE